MNEDFRFMIYGNLPYYYHQIFIQTFYIKFNYKNEFKSKILYLAMCNWSYCRSLDFDKCFYDTNIRDKNYKFQ